MNGTNNRWRLSEVIEHEQPVGFLWEADLFFPVSGTRATRLFKGLNQRTSQWFSEAIHLPSWGVNEVVQGSQIMPNSSSSGIYKYPPNSTTTIFSTR